MSIDKVNIPALKIRDIYLSGTRKFATLGESLKLDLINQNGELISINFDSLINEVN